jgi:integrase
VQNPDAVRSRWSRSQERKGDEKEREEKVAMGKLTTTEILEVAAKAAGVTVDKADEVLKRIEQYIADELKVGGHVLIPGFGSFGPIPNRRGYGRGARWPFYPAESVLNRINDSEIAPSPNPEKKQRTKRQPLRPEDETAIEGWIETMRGRASEADTEEAIYDDGTRRRTRLASEASLRHAREVMRRFAKRCPVPILQVGLSGEEGAYDNRAREIVEYADQFKAETIQRLGPDGVDKYRTAASMNREIQQTPVPFTTQAWAKFVRYALAFYDWCENQGLRPRGSNPAASLRRLPSVSMSKGQILIRRRRYEAVLQSQMSPFEAAIIFLLANGLRASEASRVRISEIDFQHRVLHVPEGKGKKQRTVPMFPWTIHALTAWLRERRDNASVWLFPSPRTEGRHITRRLIGYIVQDVARRVFAKPNEHNDRKSIHPHGFRHYFVTDAISKGVDPKSIMLAGGWSSMAIMRNYQAVDTREMFRQFDKVVKAHKKLGASGPPIVPFLDTQEA